MNYLDHLAIEVLVIQILHLHGIFDKYLNTTELCINYITEFNYQIIKFKKKTMKLMQGSLPSPNQINYVENCY